MYIKVNQTPIMVSYAVTGGRGIGFEFINQLSSKPENTVFGIVRNLSAVPKLEALLKERSNLHVYEADITDAAALKIAASKVSQVTGGKLDILINNAAWVGTENAFSPMSAFEDREEVLFDELKLSLGINVNGVILTTNAFLPLLRAGSIKKVINLSTGLGVPEFTLAAKADASISYSVSKAVLNMVTAKYAVDEKNKGVIFLALSPGLVNTATAPPTPEQIEGFMKMLVGFKAHAPHWSGQPIQPEKSVQMMLGVIDKLTPAQSGDLLSHFGNKEWL